MKRPRTRIMPGNVNYGDDEADNDDNDDDASEFFTDVKDDDADTSDNDDGKDDVNISDDAADT